MHYFFHIRAGGRWIPDEEGLEFSDLSGARMELRASALDLARAALRDRTSLDVNVLELEDETGKIVETFAMRNVFH